MVVVALVASSTGCTTLGGCQAFGDLAEGATAVATAFSNNPRVNWRSREISRGAGSAAQGLCYVGGQARVEMAGGYVDDGGMMSMPQRQVAQVSCTNPETWQEVTFCQEVVREQRELEHRRQRYQRELERESEHRIRESARRRVRYGW